MPRRRKRAASGLAAAVNMPGLGARLASMGQGSDNSARGGLVAHISAHEAAVLKAMGGRGDRNPRTGLLQFEGDGSGDGGGSGDRGGGAQDNSGGGGGGGGGSGGPNDNSAGATLSDLIAADIQSQPPLTGLESQTVADASALNNLGLTPDGTPNDYGASLGVDTSTAPSANPGPDPGTWISGSKGFNFDGMSDDAVSQIASGKSDIFGGEPAAMSAATNELAARNSASGANGTALQSTDASLAPQNLAVTNPTEFNAQIAALADAPQPTSAPSTFDALTGQPSTHGLVDSGLGWAHDPNNPSSAEFAAYNAAHEQPQNAAPSGIAGAVPSDVQTQIDQSLNQKLGNPDVTPGMLSGHGVFDTAGPSFTASAPAPSGGGPTSPAGIAGAVSPYDAGNLPAGLSGQSPTSQTAAEASGLAGAVQQNGLAADVGQAPSGAGPAGIAGAAAGPQGNEGAGGGQSIFANRDGSTVSVPAGVTAADLEKGVSPAGTGAPAKGTPSAGNGLLGTALSIAAGAIPGIPGIIKSLAISGVKQQLASGHINPAQLVQAAIMGVNPLAGLMTGGVALTNKILDQFGVSHAPYSGPQVFNSFEGNGQPSPTAAPATGSSGGLPSVLNTSTGVPTLPQYQTVGATTPAASASPFTNAELPSISGYTAQVPVNQQQNGGLAQAAATLASSDGGNNDARRLQALYTLGGALSPAQIAAEGLADGGQVGAHKFQKGSGLFPGSAPGRADTLMTHLPAGGHVVPADVVSGLGQGNTAAGAAHLKGIISRAPRAAAPKSASTPVKVSSGEFYIHPSHVAAIGGGDLDRGHAALRQMAAQVRAKAVQHAQTVDAPR